MNPADHLISASKSKTHMIFRNLRHDRYLKKDGGDRIANLEASFYEPGTV